MSRISKQTGLVCVIATLFWIMPILVSSAHAAGPFRNSGKANREHWQCIRAINYYERKYALPTNLLYALSIVESGHITGKGKVAMPWPWAINFQNKSYYFDTKAQALSFLQGLISQGHTNVDIGCAQINWGYHKHHFKNNPANALNPVYNVAYAAHFLSEKYVESRSWPGAVGHYHSANFKLGGPYAHKVYRIVNSLRGRAIMALGQTSPHDRLLYRPRPNIMNGSLGRSVKHQTRPIGAVAAAARRGVRDAKMRHGSGQGQKQHKGAQSPAALALASPMMVANSVAKKDVRAIIPSN